MASILVIEDSDDNMKLFRAVLELAGHRVTGLADGEGLCQAIEESRPDLVLMDIQLPGADGFALLKVIRGLDRPYIPVVALTAHAMAGDEARALEAGFDGYITKPIDVKGFPDHVVAVLSRREGPRFADGAS